MPGSQDDTVPGLILDPKLAAKLDGLDEHLQPIEEELREDGKKETKEESSKDDSKEAEDQESEEAESSEESDNSAEEDSSDGESSDESDSGGESDSSDESSDEGYTIDEGEEESEDEPTTPEEKAAGAAENSNLNPEQKYIIDNLQPIVVRGTVGDSAEIKEYKVYSPEYLPQGFKFADDRELSQANKAFSTLEQRAVQLQNEYRGQETQKAAQEFKKREDTADRQDIATLQRAGDLPLFKAAADSPDFEKDPGVELVQEIIDFKDSRNEKYMEEYNSGRPYKHIGFEEAFRMFKRDNPTKGNPAQVKEDRERTNVAKRTSRTNGSSSGKAEVNKPRVHSGMGPMDLENLIESKTADW